MQLLIIAFLFLILCGCGVNSSLPNSPELANASSSAVIGPSDQSSSASTTIGSGTLSVTFTPINNRGGYSPKNVYAVWITDASGKWVANLGARVQKRYRYLTEWRKVYVKVPTKGVDGITGATASSFSTFSGVWDASKVPKSNYTLHMEFTTGNGSGPHATVTFSTANGAFDLAKTFTNYKNVTLKYTP